jgi:hypothetical protein
MLRHRVPNYWLNLKNICEPVMGLVTVFCPLTTALVGETALQAADEPRLVLDSKVNPVALVGHVKTTLAPEGMMVSCGVGAQT